MSTAEAKEAVEKMTAVVAARRIVRRECSGQIEGRGRVVLLTAADLMACKLPASDIRFEQRTLASDLKSSYYHPVETTDYLQHRNLAFGEHRNFHKSSQPSARHEMFFDCPCLRLFVTGQYNHHQQPESPQS